jgi:hypothetical protein
MANTSLTWNPGFFEGFLYRAPGIIASVQEAADRVAAIARGSAPVDTGVYRNSIRVQIKFQQRAVAIVVADCDHAMIVESRTGNLARALRSVGG